MAAAIVLLIAGVLGYGLLFIAGITCSIVWSFLGQREPRQKINLYPQSRNVTLFVTASYLILSVLGAAVPNLSLAAMKYLHNINAATANDSGFWSLIFFNPLSADLEAGPPYLYLVAGALAIPIAFAAYQLLCNRTKYASPELTAHGRIIGVVLFGWFIAVLGAGFFLLTAGIMFFGSSGSGLFASAMVWICAVLSLLVLMLSSELARYTMDAFILT
ncbi:MAG: hypothetical protein R3D05_05740 [Dongiaceae bacterium]